MMVHSNPDVIIVHTLEEALEQLQQHGEDAKILAGGTALVLMLHHGLISPSVLVGIQSIPELHFVEERPEHLALGALVSIQEVARHPLVRQHIPALATACRHVGNIRVRYQATIGGNLAEADYASDPPTVFALMDATVVARSAQGERHIPIRDFFQGFYTTALQPDELIVSVHIPLPPPDTRLWYQRFTTRSRHDRPCVNVAIWLRQEGQVCRELRIAVGAACEMPVRFPDVEGWAAGEPLRPSTIQEIAHEYAQRIDPLDDLRGSAWYRRHLVEVLIRRGLEEVGNAPR